MKANFYGPLIFLEAEFKLQNNSYEGMVKPDYADSPLQLWSATLHQELLKIRFYIYDNHDFDFTRKAIILKPGLCR